MRIAQTFGRIIRTTATALKLRNVDASPSAIDSAKAPGELMTALTGNESWEDRHNLGSGPYTSLKTKVGDPSILATTYALYKIGLTDVVQEPFSEYDPFSGRTRMYIPETLRQDGFLDVCAWLTPLKDRVELNDIPRSQLKGRELYDSQEIRILMDDKMAYLKSNANSFKHHYQEAIKLGWDVLRTNESTQKLPSRTTAPLALDA
jgi:hypothetical protein